jgi:hypothetical protein
MSIAWSARWKPITDRHRRDAAAVQVGLGGRPSHQA